MLSSCLEKDKEMSAISSSTTRELEHDNLQPVGPSLSTHGSQKDGQSIHINHYYS
jgi:hypothetical protein